MNDICISFYLRAGRIHIFAETLRCIGSPKRICFMIAVDGQSLLMRAYEKRDFKSLKVPRNVYDGKRSLEISSRMLCEILAGLHGWDSTYSYRVPGIILKDRLSVLFPLTKAAKIQFMGWRADHTRKRSGDNL